MQKPRKPRLSVTVLRTLLMIPVVPVAIVSAAVSPLNFDGGVGTSSYDQYTGKAGGGWAGEWTVVVSEGSPDYSATTVSSDSPLYTDGGNYLKASITSNGANKVQQAVFRRGIDSSAIDLTQAFSCSFYFRTDSTPGTDASSDNAQYYIFSNPTATSGTNSNNTWAIQSTNAADSIWRLQNGSSTVDSTMAVTAGTVYLFTIDTNPATKTYTVTIFNGTDTYMSPSLSWRATTATQEGAFIHFAVKDATPNNSVDTVGFSLDHIILSQVPEPAAAALLFGGTALVLIGLARCKLWN
ncbi:MAG: hypothetical protein LBK99_01115 [Opitutaceae bacterium]|nr:hypothetical protein [Opitutaceae bacterium]